ncbi:hypothetical protein AMJ52_05230 [candidate division TA06 bacterium DG_78]|uniref:Glycosyl hydrolase-like 10 domain-containing protein n=1 Tax=candidate division TA06 bacterium DG_78 TaxID=1703772 RepID=A0A0S7YEF3_UNCT6|nr:MAG: hypothetical protein AMJ52_05230 [candidate division TA06 bacterium DG_78]
MGILVLLFILHTDFRGIWIPRWSITDYNKIFEHLDGRFNHIFLQVFASGEAYYPSKYVPSRMLSDAWLKEFIHEAHRRNIKVSAWINTFYSWGYAPWTPNSEHPINRYPEWYVRDQYQESILDYDVDRLRQMGIEGYYLAPANSEVRLYITRIIEELLNYDFDGIHLDYIRYPSQEFIYDSFLRTKFMRKFSIDPSDLFTSPDSLKRKLSIWGYDDFKSQWFRFVKDDLTLFIKDLNNIIKVTYPNIEISVAVKANHVTARAGYHQEWVTWLNSDFVDFVCLMAYTKDIDGILASTLKAVDEPRRVVVGLGLYLLSPSEVEKQLRLVHDSPFAGVVFFSYEEVKKNRRYLSSL